MGDIVSAAPDHFLIDGRGKAGRRFSCEANLRDGSDDSFYSGFSQDITRSGVFVATYDIRPVGAKASVRVTFGGAEAYCVDSVVEWVREPHPFVNDVLPGMGLRFEAFDPEFATRFYAHIEERPPYFIDTQGSPASSIAPQAALSQPADPAFLDADALDALEKIRERLLEMNQADPAFVREEGPRIGDDAAQRWSSPPPRRDPPVRQASPDVSGAQICFVGDVDGMLSVSPTKEHFDRQFRGGFEDTDGLLVAFVRSGDLRPMGCRLVVTITSGGTEVGALVGRVRWRRRLNPTLGHTGSPPGMGLRFEEVLRGTALGLGALWDRGCPVFQEV